MARVLKARNAKRKQDALTSISSRFNVLQIFSLRENRLLDDNNPAACRYTRRNLKYLFGKYRLRVDARDRISQGGEFEEKSSNVESCVLFSANPLFSFYQIPSPHFSHSLIQCVHSHSLSVQRNEQNRIESETVPPNEYFWHHLQRRFAMSFLDNNRD